MKIVKQFDSPEFFKRHHYLALEEDELKKGNWKWGLSSDGKLYCQSSEFADPNEWYDYDSLVSYKADFCDMVKIVKQFGHLLNFT